MARRRSHHSIIRHRVDNDKPAGYASPPFALFGSAMHSWRYFAAPLALLSLAASCSLLDVDEKQPDAARKGLAKILADDRIAVEVFFVHVSPDDQPRIDDAWTHVDEQALPTALRQQLAQHGFRVGVVGSQLPAAIDEIVRTQGSTATASQAQADVSEAQPIASRQELRLRPGKRGEIVPSPVHEKLTVMTWNDGELTGRTYESIQGKFRVQCQPQGDGRVRVELTPELHHGKPKRQWVGDDGVWRLDTGQERVIFDHLRITALLTPTEHLLISARDQPLRSLGRDFLFSANSGKPVQKLLVLRLIKSEYDDTLATLVE
jgi:hypothetical protein